jgi:hypothetical protein
VTTFSEALAAACPWCSATPGAPCRKMTPPVVEQWFRRNPTPPPLSFAEWAFRVMDDDLYAMYGEIGKWIDRPHNARFNAGTPALQGAAPTEQEAGAPTVRSPGYRDPIEIRCRKCGAGPGKPCAKISSQVEFWFKVHPAPEGRSRDDWARAAMPEGLYRIFLTVGGPIANVHNERRIVALRRRAGAGKPAPLPAAPAALVSLRALDLAEHNRLKDWLRVWGPVLWARPREAPEQLRLF